MNTIWHAFWTYILFRNQKKKELAVIASIVPDLPQLISLGLLFITQGLNWNSFSSWSPSHATVTIAILLHSLVVIIPLFLVCILLKKKQYYIWFYGWLFHVALDFVTHFDDNYPPFWPLSNWKFTGFFSYWNPAHHSLVFDIIHTLLVVIVLIYLIKKTKPLIFEKTLFAGLTIYLIILEFFYINSPGFITQALLNGILLLLMLWYLGKALLKKQKA